MAQDARSSEDLFSSFNLADHSGPATASIERNQARVVASLATTENAVRRFNRSFRDNFKEAFRLGNIVGGLDTQSFFYNLHNTIAYGWERSGGFASIFGKMRGLGSGIGDVFGSISDKVKDIFSGSSFGRPGGMFDGLRLHGMYAADKIGDTFSKVFTGIGGLGQRVFAQLGVWARGFGTVAAGAFKLIDSVFMGTLTSMGELFKAVFVDLPTKAIGLIGSLFARIATAGGAVGGVLARIGGVFGTFLGNFLGFAWGLIKNVGGFLFGILKAIPGAIWAIGKGIFNIGKNIGETLLNIFAGVAKTIGSVFDGALQAIGFVGQAIAGLIGAAAHVATAFTIAGGVILGVFGMIAKSALQTSATFETFATTMGAIFNDQALGQQAMSWIENFAMKSAFAFQDLAEAGTRLAAFGLGIQKWLPWLSNLGTAFGGTRQQLLELVHAIGEFSAGRTGRALYTLSMFGVRRRDLEKEGLQFDKGGELLSPINEALAAVYKVVQEKFGNINQSISGTLAIMFSNLGDAWTKAMRQIGDVFSTFIKPILSGLIELINNLTNAGVWGRLATMVTDFLGQFNWIEIIKNTIAGLLASLLVIPKAIDIVKDAWRDFVFDFNAFGQNMITWWTVNSKVLVDFWLLFKDAARSELLAIAQFFGATFDFIGMVLKTAWDKIKGFFEMLGNAVRAVAMFLAPGIVGIFDGIRKAFDMGAFSQEGSDGPLSDLINKFNRLRNISKNNADQIKHDWEGTLEWAKSAVAGAISQLDQFFSKNRANFGGAAANIIGEWRKERDKLLGIINGVGATNITGGDVILPGDENFNSDTDTLLGSIDSTLSKMSKDTDYLRDLKNFVIGGGERAKVATSRAELFMGRLGLIGGDGEIDTTSAIGSRGGGITAGGRRRGIGDNRPSLQIQVDGGDAMTQAVGEIVRQVVGQLFDQMGNGGFATNTSPNLSHF